MIDRATVWLFGVGGMALGIVGNAVSYFLLVYYNQVMHVPAYLVSLSLAVALVADALIDPLVGMLSDRTRTRWGRRHPYLYGALLPLPFLYFCLWNPPAWAFASDVVSFVYLTALLIVFRTVLACFDIPSNAMVPELTTNYDARTALMSARLSTAWVAGVAFTIAMYGVFLQPTAEHPDGVLNGDGYRTASWLGAALILVSIAISSLGTHRHVQTLRAARPLTPFALRGAFDTVRAIFKNRPFRALMTYAIVYRSTDGLFAALWIYLVTFFWLLDTSQIAILSSMNLIGAAVAMGITPLLAQHRDKRTIVLAANFASIVTSCMPITLRLLGWLPDQWVFRTLLATSVFDVFLTVVTVSLLASMITDLVEDVQRADGRRHEGAIISAQTFISKLSTASGTWTAGLVLTAIAFPRTTAVADVTHEKAASLGFTYLMVLYVSIAACGLLLLRYKLNRVAHEANVANVSAIATEQS